MGRRKHFKNMSPNEFLVHMVRDLDTNVVDTWLLLYAAQLGMHKVMEEAKKAPKDSVMGLISVEYTKERLRKWLEMYDQWNTK